MNDALNLTEGEIYTLERREFSPTLTTSMEKLVEMDQNCRVYLVRQQTFLRTTFGNASFLGNGAITTDRHLIIVTLLEIDERPEPVGTAASRTQR